MSATYRKLLLVCAAALVLSGCTAATPDEQAWQQCTAFYDEHKPNGIVSAENGETYDSDRICHNMIGTRGQDYFTEFWNDAEQVEQYSRGF